MPTPLGNLRDITIRALDTLRAAALIVAEDTRVAQRLCHALNVAAPPIMAFHAHSGPGRTDEIVGRAAQELVAVLSDAGMPGISDPGSELVRAARAAGVAVEVLPGPCAFVGAAVLSGLPIVGLQFLGFVPRRAGARESAFRTALRAGHTVAWYESPHRISPTLTHLAQLDANAAVFVLREYTKRFEQQIFGTPDVVLAALETPVRGEITLVFRRDQAFEESGPAESETLSRMHALLGEDLKPSAIAKLLAQEGHGDRNELYLDIQRLRDLRSGLPDDEA